jgi:hypothetical protein
LSDGQVFAGYANRLADEFLTALEYRVGAFANVFDSNTGEPSFAHRVGHCKFTVGTLLRT